jgi:glycosyltransferase involved in cell wall biosynthesis
MKVLQVHNHHQSRGGEEIMFETISRTLTEKGHDVFVFERDNRDVQGLWGKICAFRDGNYSSSAKKTILSILESEHPDIVHVHNVYTLISPSVLVACGHFDVPVVIRCADFRFISCPIGNHLRNGSICEQCIGGREFCCVLRNCKGNICESVAYAMRTAVARKLRLFKDNVTLFAPPSKFVRQRLIEAEFPQERIIVIPNMVSIPDAVEENSCGKYVAYAGRISPEKGIETLLAAAGQTGLPVRIAGDNSKIPESVKTIPSNTQFMGFLDRDQLAGFYRNAQFSVVPSICFETFGLVAAEAMSHGLPVIASKIGALPEIVEDGVTGFLFDPGNSEELAGMMRLLWESPDLCRKMGEAARDKVIREYGEDLYYKRLMETYHRAIELKKES